MQYAIVEINGRQFWMETGKYYDINRVSIKLGEKICLNRILLFNNNGEILIGKPYLEKIKIKGIIIKHLLGAKKIIYKMKPKKKTRKKQGHRQQLTRVLIDKIMIGS
mmetsp:Transcript_25843/g.39596  ORF Transcript_25843/g.39596 Transcript_25843/m.39596 type:complete len:107 (+) Transcript_25843:964-1284(+)